MNLKDALQWRYAAKKYTDAKVPAEKVDEIVEAVRLSASSAGIQPYRVWVIEDPEVKKQLQEASFNIQVTESSHLLVFAAYERITQRHLDEYIRLISETRNLPAENLADLKTRMEGYLLSLSDEETFRWASRQAYIALGTGLVAAAGLGVDSTPMEGFQADEFDRILGLREKGLKSVVLLALGYRDEARDPLAGMKKVRVPKEEFSTGIR